MSAAQLHGATVRAVRDLFDDCFQFGTVEGTSAGFRAYTARGLGLDTFSSEFVAEAAVYAAGRKRRSTHR